MFCTLLCNVMARKVCLGMGRSLVSSVPLMLMLSIQLSVPLIVPQYSQYSQFSCCCQSSPVNLPTVQPVLSMFPCQSSLASSLRARVCDARLLSIFPSVQPVLLNHPVVSLSCMLRESPPSGAGMGMTFGEAISDSSNCKAPLLAFAIAMPILRCGLWRDPLPSIGGNCTPSPSPLPTQSLTASSQLHNVLCYSFHL
jgi:hypothetical protein